MVNFSLVRDCLLRDDGLKFAIVAIIALVIMAVEKIFGLRVAKSKVGIRF